MESCLVFVLGSRRALNLNRQERIQITQPKGAMFLDITGLVSVYLGSLSGDVYLSTVSYWCKNKMLFCLTMRK